MRKIDTLLTILLSSVVLLSSCKKDKETDNTNNTDNGITGDTDVIKLMDNVGFVSTNSDYNTLYGGGAVNDFLLELDEKAAGDDVNRLELVVRNGDKSDTLDLTAIGNSPKDITVEKYIRHFQLEVASIANANDVNAEIYAFDDNDKQLGKIKFTLNTKSTKLAGVQPLQFPTSGFYNANNVYWPYENNTIAFIGDLDETGSDGDQYFIAVRIYYGGKELKSDAVIEYADEKNNDNEIYIEKIRQDIQGENNSSNFVLFLHDDENDQTEDSSLTIDAGKHFIDHDNNPQTARVATYRVYSPFMPPHFEFNIIEK